MTPKGYLSEVERKGLIEFNKYWNEVKVKPGIVEQPDIVKKRTRTAARGVYMHAFFRGQFLAYKDEILDSINDSMKALKELNDAYKMPNKTKKRK